MDKFDQIVEDYDDFIDDLLSSSHQTFPDKLKRYLSFIDDCAPINVVLSKELPSVEFESWYGSAKQSVGSMVGSGNLDWPTNKNESIAMHIELMRHVSQDFDLLLNFCLDFLYSENHFDIMVSDFNSQIIEPTVRDIKKLFLRSRAPSKVLPAQSIEKQVTWYQRPVGIIGIGLFITIVGGLFLANYS